MSICYKPCDNPKCNEVSSDCDGFWCDCGATFCDERCGVSNNIDFCVDPQYISTSCILCREEDFKDSSLLELALEKLKMSRKELVDELHSLHEGYPER